MKLLDDSDALRIAGYICPECKKEFIPIQFDEYQISSMGSGEYSPTIKGLLHQTKKNIYSGYIRDGYRTCNATSLWLNESRRFNLCY